MYSTRFATRISGLGLFGAALLCFSLLSGCASVHETAPATLPLPPPAPLPAPPPAPPEPLPTATLEAGKAVSLDQYRLTLPFDLVLRNPGRGDLAVRSLDCELLVAGEAAGTQSLGGGRILPRGGELSLPLEFALDLRRLDGALSGRGGAATGQWSLDVRVGLETSEGQSLTLPVEASGSFPIIREPIFSISSVRVERDLLVTTQLALGLEMYNPNDFPLEFSSFDYDFYGEGRIWSGGRDEGPATIPPEGNLRRPLRFTMNFANMDRRLFDLVAKLKVVRYRIAGEARIATGLDFLPAFVSRFDTEGSCAVER